VIEDHYENREVVIEVVSALPENKKIYFSKVSSDAILSACCIR
jgi:hypothetical protein